MKHGSTTRIRRPRFVYAPGGEYGLIEISVNDPRQRSILGHYWNAVHFFLDTGDDEPLTEFRGSLIKTTDGTSVPLITDLDWLEYHAYLGQLSFESLYVEI